MSYKNNNITNIASKLETSNKLCLVLGVRRDSRLKLKYLISMTGSKIVTVAI
jgi:hypothetical protein